MLLIAGDVGGTKTLLTLARLEGGALRILAEKRFPSAEYHDLVSMLQPLRDAAGVPRTAVDAACFAIAGPVDGDDEHQTARLTHLPWQLDNLAIAREGGIRRVRLINDLAGIAHAIDILAPEQRSVLQAGAPVPGGARLVAAPGTGFNSAVICPDAGGNLRVLAAESGHAAFAPRGARQLALARFIDAREGQCSREHVLAGPGLPRLLAFLSDYTGQGPSPGLQQAMSGQDPSAAIGAAALAGEDPLAVATLEFYAELLAGQLADLALCALPRAGLFLGGGVPPKVLPFLQTEAFRAAFNDRPPMQRLLAACRVEVLLDERAGLRGALEAARRLLAQDCGM